MWTRFAKVDGFHNALKSARMLLCDNRTNCDDLLVSHVHAAKKKAHDSAVTFDIEQALPRIWKALLQPSFEGRDNPVNTALLRTCVWTMLMMGLVCIARAPLFTNYCPHIEDMELGELDDNNIPCYFVLVLRRRKGNADGRLRQRLHIRRNYMHPAYCPVVINLVFWLKTTHVQGIHSAPLLPYMDIYLTRKLREVREVREVRLLYERA